jgi:hypothetical protein
MDSSTIQSDWVWAMIPVVGYMAYHTIRIGGNQLWVQRSTKEQAEKAKLIHEQEMEKACDRWYVRRERHHEDMGRISGIMSRLQLDLGTVEVTLARQGAAIEAMAEAIRDHGVTLRDILLHTRQLNERDQQLYDEGRKRRQSQE